MAATKPSPSRKRHDKAEMLNAMAVHVLAHGLAEASLRPLAKAAGTSDRMLLYHFGTKAKLMDALLEHLTVLYAGALDAAFPGGRASSRKACLDSVMRVTRKPEFQPFLRVWWQAVAGGASGESQWTDSTGRIMGILLEWLEGHLPEDDPNPSETARLMLAVIEGAQMLEAVGRRDIADAAIANAFKE